MAVQRLAVTTEKTLRESVVVPCDRITRLERNRFAQVCNGSFVHALTRERGFDEPGGFLVAQRIVGHERVLVVNLVRDRRFSLR